MIYVGIDQSYTCTGMVAVRDGEVLFEGKYKFKKEDYKQISETMGKMFADLAKVEYDYDDACVLCIEGYAYSSKFTNNLVHMGELGGIIKGGVCQEYGSIAVVPPTTVKKFVTGKGNCAKDVVMKEAFKKWGYDNSNNNLVDAFCIAMLIATEQSGDIELSKKLHWIEWEPE
jgi:crossover junction endodeoxyribonuclease RuvC